MIFSYKKLLSSVLFLLVMILAINCSKDKKEEQVTTDSVIAKNSDSTFIFQEYHLAIDAPKNWSVEKLSENTFVFKMKCDSGIFCPNLIARFVPLERELTLENCAESFLFSFQEKYKNFELVSSLDKQVRKFKIKVVDYKMFENEINLGGTTAFIILEDKSHAFALSIMAENENGSYINYRRLFENILNSIKPA